MNSTPPAGTGLKAVSLERRLALAFGLYAAALFLLLAVIMGSIPTALFVIMGAEVMLLLWRPTPRLGQAAYKPPVGSAWQDPIMVMRWYVLIRTGVGLVVGAVVVTAFFAFLIIAALKSTGLGLGSYAVIAVVAVWLGSRWFWAPPLERWAGGKLIGYGEPRMDTLQVGVDGLNIVAEFPPRAVPRVFQVLYSEIDELRLLSWLDGRNYWDTLAQYDPTLAARASWELIRFLQGADRRPSIFIAAGQGMNLLIRGPQFVYTVGWADRTGPLAISAWQEWRAAHVQQPAAPTA